MIDINYYVKNYSYLVEFSSEDEDYLAKCFELGIMAHGDSQEETIQEIKEAVMVHLLMLIEDGDEIPEPQSIMVNL
ncbi:type II toxin-antitoxin system HicB family antitoxin [Crocosphaera sp. UHCC 0190]|uniref:type II toxin-antitoxin system HicB family antitoxin n=1 Tax=Crocosphaera sp. UHCC 0190 TaxID=3110246 RepID=UPI002B1FD401|nr:type II toxin-antitoxin system HicB family antitoxin [Crocosphaera sp. UHCC 0190]MEA5510617.1 type II toxin-antitoxin system HicB family antitoxin [Crocosphaera sp. UHCC 0190]